MPAELFNTTDQPPLMISCIPAVITVLLALLAWLFGKVLKRKLPEPRLLKYYCDFCNQDWDDEENREGFRHCPYCDNPCEGRDPETGDPV